MNRQSEKFIEDITHNGERYEVKLPFKEGHPILPDSYQLSKTRLESLLRRLKLKLEVLKHYDEVIQEKLGRSIIEPVNLEERRAVSNVHYLPKEKPSDLIRTLLSSVSYMMHLRSAGDQVSTIACTLDCLLLL